MNGHQGEVEAWWATSPLSGAIGVLHLSGAFDDLLQTLVGRVPEVGTTALVDMGSIDTGLVARPTETSALLMPHGGPHIRRRLSEAVVKHGARFIDTGRSDPRQRWPEADTLVEACMLDRLARTASPRSIPMLLQQPERHASARRDGWHPDERDERRASILEALLEPPLIAIVGAPNVGKSSLLNRLAGRDVAITADVPGTTRDAVTARIELDGVACILIDLPGERASEDPIEQRAIALSKAFLRDARLVIALVEPDRPDPPDFERTPDLVVRNKCDHAENDDGFEISAMTGAGIAGFTRLVRRTILPDEVLEGEGRPWCFHPALLPEPQSPTIE